MQFSHEQIVKISLDNDAPWILVALKDMEDGVRRLPGDANHPRILEYWKHTNYNPESDDESFCAASMCTWLEESGYKSPHDPAAISFQQLPRLTEYKPGCLIVFRRPGEAWQRHITCAIYYDEKEKLFYCLGGNQGDTHSVCIKTYSIEKVDSYHWPKKSRGMQ